MKILFIGNSHTFFNDMPHTVAGLFGACGLETPDVTMLTIGGMTLDWHYEQPQTRFNIAYGHYDFVVLQDVAHPFVGREKLLSDVGLMMQLIEKTDTRPCLYMTWSEQIKPEIQAPMRDAYRLASETYGTLLARAGEAWDIIRHTCPEITLYYSDGEHASPYGSYLAACAIFCAIAGVEHFAPNPGDPTYATYDAKICRRIESAVRDVSSR